MANCANDFEPSSLVVQQTEIYYDARTDTGATHSELGPIIGDNIVGYAKLVHDLFDEFHHLGCCNRCGKLHFDPFCEFNHRYKDLSLYYIFCHG